MINEAMASASLASPACLCAGLRRRNAVLCLKCEIEMMPDTFPELENDSFDIGFQKAKNHILRLLEQ